MKKILYLCVFVVFALFAITVHMQNDQAIPINYYFGISWDVPLFWVIMLPFFVGMILGVLVMGLSVFKNKRQAGKSRKALVKAEKEVQSLRAMPLNESDSGNAQAKAVISTTP